MSDKIDVNGDNRDAIYAQLAEVPDSAGEAD
jgi:glutathione peroxidase-family protein